ncbi:DUF1015 domain-containing protein [candidate division WOR-3 bacterium]|nr:DUF1015 domain-containing protein [candidate division WOR-3 bacterium]
MAEVRPFKALRPILDLVNKIAAPPYDVVSSNEARILAKDDKYSFLHVTKPEIDLDPSIDLYDEKVYIKGSENMKLFIENGWLVQDNTQNYYIYRQIMGTHSQVGIVACASADDYESDIIKKHEFTRKDKEDDRLKHILSLNANTGPVFLTYRAKKKIDDFVDSFIKNNSPVYDFKTSDGISHTFWVVSGKDEIEFMKKSFNEIDVLYVADGHHRSASAVRAREVYSQKNPNHTGEEEYNFFLSVIFPDEQMNIIDYNRVVKDLNCYSKDMFLVKVGEIFEVNKIQCSDPENCKPSEKHRFLMYIDGVFYSLKAREKLLNSEDTLELLDVNILQKNLLAPILGIQDPRTDKRIDFIGGIRGIKELKNLVDSGKFQIAFSLYPVGIDELIKIADSGKTMPPKSTWFEPKLRSGLAVHMLS